MNTQLLSSIDSIEASIRQLTDEVGALRQLVESDPEPRTPVGRVRKITAVSVPGQGMMDKPLLKAYAKALVECADADLIIRTISLLAQYPNTWITSETMRSWLDITRKKQSQMHSVMSRTMRVVAHERVPSGQLVWPMEWGRTSTGLKYRMDPIVAGWWQQIINEVAPQLDLVRRD